MNPERLPLTFGTGPFVETVGWNDATAQPKRFAEAWPLFERFGFGVYELAGAAVVLCPTIDQTPACAERFTTFEF
jgi:hypothetical protein